MRFQIYQHSYYYNSSISFFRTIDQWRNNVSSYLNLKNENEGLRQENLKLRSQLPKSKLSIAESGIYDLATYQLLKQEGFDGFLMGEYFMKQANPAAAFEAFVTSIKSEEDAV